MKLITYFLSFSDYDFFDEFYGRHYEHDYFPLDVPKCSVKFSATAPGCL